MDEIWKDVVGYEDYYEVSSMGKIKSKTRLVPHSRSRSGKLILKGVIIASSLNRGGYPITHLCRDGKSKTRSVHQIVARAFIHNIHNKPYVNHKDGDKLNNNIENLEWVTSKENSIHAHECGLINKARGSKIHLAKLNDEVVIEMRKMRHSGAQYTAIGKTFTITPHAARMACTGRTWTHVNYPICAYVKYKSIIRHNI